MARDPVPARSSLTSALRTFSRPWPILLAGLACTVIGLLFAQTAYVPARLLFVGAGVLIAGIAVARRLQTTSWELEDRVESAGLLALSAFVALLAYEGMDEKWDSGCLFLGVLIGVALAASFLVLLPRLVRRVVLLLVVVLHFGGILTAVTTVPPRGDAAPWMSAQLWGHIYRHYLTFMYLTNAYHFYSPDPGPPTLLWFYVQYADGSSRWIKLPNRSESPVNLHHQRMLATTESTNSPGGPAFLRDYIPIWEEKNNRKYEILPGIPHDSREVIWERRQVGSSLPYKDSKGNPAPIQLIADELPDNQYSEPQEIARRLIASYARHIARTTPHLEDPAVPVSYVRVYRITHTLISPKEFSEKGSSFLLDETTYTPFYMGKYDINGKLLDPKDPFLFWVVPIMRVPERYPDNAFLWARTPQQGPLKLLNFVEIHATQTDRIQTDD
jgi:hypothetical protein